MDRLEPVLEISLKLSRLNLHGGFAEPNVYVTVEFSPNGDGTWIPFSHTETIQSRKNCSFFTAFSFYPQNNINPKSLLKFTFKRMRRTDQAERLGSGTCTISHLISRSPIPTNIELTLNEMLIGHIETTVVKVSQQLLEEIKKETLLIEVPESLKTDSQMPTSSLQSPDLLTTLINPIVQAFRVATKSSNDLRICESMFETTISFSIPLSYVQLCVCDVSRKMNRLKTIGKLKPPFESNRLSKLKQCETLLDRYSDCMKAMMKHSRNPCIKKSCEKSLADLSYLPINLHIQRLSVDHLPASDTKLTNESNSLSTHTRSKCESFQYNFVTIGAAAAHSLGFKQGGLLHLLQTTSAYQSNKSRLPNNELQYILNICQSADDAVIELEDQITICYEGLISLLRSLKKLVTDIEEDTDEAFDTVGKISEKVAQFISFCDNKDLKKANQVLFGNLLNQSAQILNQSNELTADNQLEEYKLKIRTSLADLVKSIEFDKKIKAENTSTPTEDQINPHNLLNNSISQLEHHVDILYKQATRALSHHQIIQPNFTELYSDLYYRRTMVYSQALSMCACGVATTIFTALSEQSTDVLNQYDKCGILLQVESLLSTYGNELGMIQDYIVGVMDLCNLSVQFDDVQKIPSIDGFPIQLTGTVFKPILKIYLKKEDMKLMPKRLQNGGLLEIYPAFFNVGINQEQTLAEKFGDTSLQEYINRQGLQRLVTYHQKVLKNSPQTIKTLPSGSFDEDHQITCVATGFIPRMKSSFVGASQSPLSDLRDFGKNIEEVLDKIRSSLQNKKSKPVEVLQRSAEICRRLNGIRVTSCKSAKDRTAMSITLEECTLLLQNHGLHEKNFFSLLSALRSNGTRLENTLKNVGQRKYAFASVQLMTFPKLYRPPDGTYGKVET